MVKNILCAVLHAEAEQEFDLFVADLHHVGLPEAPEHLLLRLIEIVPQRLAQVRIVGDELAVCLCIFHGAIRRCPRRLARERERPEVEHPRFVDERKIQLVKRQLRVRAGLARESKFAVAVFVQRHERQRCEHIVRRHKSLRLDPRAPQRIGQKFAERVRAHLAEHPHLPAEFGDRRKEIRRGPARMRSHCGIAVRVDRLRRKVDQKLTKRNYIIHSFSSVIVMLH